MEIDIYEIIGDNNHIAFTNYWKDFKDKKFGQQQYNLLQWVIMEFKPQLLEILLDDGYYDINEQNPSSKKTAIILAMDEFKDESEEMAEMIFKYYPDVDVDLADKYGRNAVLAGMMSGISSRYIMMASDRTKNLEQFDHEMKETVIDACIRNEGMYRQHAQILASYIRRGAKVSGQQIYKMMELTKSRKLSSVWKAIDGREELIDVVYKIAAEMGYDEFLPQEVQDVFLF